MKSIRSYWLNVNRAGTNQTEFKINDRTYFKLFLGLSIGYKNCKSLVHEKGYRGNPLSEIQKESNNIKSKIRARVRA